MKLNFKNDYNTIGDIKILNKLIEYKDEKNIGYGEDYHSKELNDMVNSIIGKNSDTYILSGGTITNVIGLSQILKYPYEAVITGENSHINVHETGAIESASHKIILTPLKNGKIDISKIKDTYNKFTDNHMVLPKCLYLSDANELGLTYTIEELKEISNICKELNLYFYIDGARLPESLVSEGYTLKDIASLCDMFYLGGTKNGLPFGELLVIINDELKSNFKFLLKNKLGLLAKGFVGAIMFKEYLKDNYYLRLASKALTYANKIRDRLNKYLIYPNKTNQIFIKVSNDIFDKLNEQVEFEIWEVSDSYKVIRLVTSYNTSDDEINALFNIFDNLGD
ncbi:MAG: aminotransferase class I/II-fold pyridoxal phosphate-dependent enzyme [Acholeplasmatales bacterium]|nr:aminotransferase class I/II-fold pyridoxal phosphate-dependent enzyme [Acholeplasmatales bacterium]